MKELFSFGLPLCRKLQSQRIDLKNAVQLAEDTITSLKNMRVNAEIEFHIIYNSMEVIILCCIKLKIENLNKFMFLLCILSSENGKSY